MLKPVSHVTPCTLTAIRFQSVNSDLLGHAPATLMVDNINPAAPVPADLSVDAAALPSQAATSASTLGIGDISHRFKNASDQVPELKGKSAYNVGSFLTKVRNR